MKFLILTRCLKVRILASAIDCTDVCWLLQAAGLFCEIHAGTILGVLKFNNNLPWDVDADIHFETSNLSAFLKIAGPKVKAAGLTIVSPFSLLYHC